MKQNFTKQYVLLQHAVHSKISYSILVYGFFSLPFFLSFFFS